MLPVVRLPCPRVKFLIQIRPMQIRETTIPSHILRCLQYRSVILLVDSDHHGDDYVTFIDVDANKILVLPIRSFFVKVNAILHEWLVSSTITK